MASAAASALAKRVRLISIDGERRARGAARGALEALVGVLLPRPAGEQARRLAGVGEPRRLLLQRPRAIGNAQETGTNLFRGGKEIAQCAFLGRHTGQCAPDDEEQHDDGDCCQTMHLSTPEPTVAVRVALVLERARCSRCVFAGSAPGRGVHAILPERGNGIDRGRWALTEHLLTPARTTTDHGTSPFSHDAAGDGRDRHCGGAGRPPSRLALPGAAGGPAYRAARAGAAVRVGGSRLL